MDTFNYSFRDMVDWYDTSKDDADLFECDKNVIAFFIDQVQKYEQVSTKQLKKRGLDDVGSSHGHLSKFIKQNVTANDIRRIKFIIDNAMYPLGLYYVKQNENNVFFVKPVLKTDEFSNVKQFMSGDHFSFPFVSKKKEIHLHFTAYTPVPTNINIGQITHYPRNVFLDGVALPVNGYNT